MMAALDTIIFSFVETLLFMSCFWYWWKQGNYLSSNQDAGATPVVGAGQETLTQFFTAYAMISAPHVWTCHLRASPLPPTYVAGPARPCCVRLSLLF